MFLVSSARRLALAAIVAASVLGDRARAVDVRLSCTVEDDPLAGDANAQASVEAPRVGAQCTAPRPIDEPRRITRGSSLRCEDSPPASDHCAARPTWATGLIPSDLGPADPELVGHAIMRLTETVGGRAQLGAALRRSGRYRRDVVAALGARHLPIELEAVVLVESGYFPLATSPAGASGLWQLMPETAKNLGLRVDRAVDERRNVRRSSAAAAQHLSDLYAMFGSWDLVLAAYNFGAGRVLDRMQRAGAMTFWSLAADGRSLPRETRDYVPQVLAVAIVLRNLDHFGFDPMDREREQPSSELDVPGGTSLDLVARAAATSLRNLRALNPSIAGLDRVPIDAIAFSIEVPATTLGRARAMLPGLIDGGDAVRVEVPDDFDWGTNADVRGAAARLAQNRATSESEPSPTLALRCLCSPSGAQRSATVEDATASARDQGRADATFALFAGRDSGE